MRKTSLVSFMRYLAPGRNAPLTRTPAALDRAEPEPSNEAPGETLAGCFKFLT
jgi:hypothetical protein